MEFGFVTGFGACFLLGLEMPKLMRKNLKPLRSESATLIDNAFPGYLQLILLRAMSAIRRSLLGCWGFRSRDAGVGFGRRSGGAVEDVEYGGWHGLVGVSQEDTHLPHLVIAELRFERRHPGEADAIKDFPVGLAGWVVAYADYIRIVVVGLKQGWCIGVHVGADGRRLVVESVAEGAAVNVDMRAGGEIGLIGLHVRSDLFFLNARVERHVNDLGLVRERAIGDCYRHIAIHKVSKPNERDQDNADYEAEQESHNWCSLRRFSSYCIEPGTRQKELACVQWMTAPRSVCDELCSRPAKERLRNGLSGSQVSGLRLEIVDGSGQATLVCDNNDRGAIGSVRCFTPWTKV